MGLPLINIVFAETASSAMIRSARGIVALILKDDTLASGETIYSGIDEVKSSDWTASNLDYISKTFLGTPSKIIIERIATTAIDYNGALLILKNKKFNYLAIPDILVADVANMSTWIKSRRDTDHKTFKAVLPNSISDHEGIINFTTDVMVGTKEYTVGQYCCRIAGIMAGISLSRSSTYYILSEVTSITDSTTPDADIDAGKLILVNDGTNVKIGRGVNSLTTTSATKGNEYKKIKIVEGMDLVRDDINDTFNLKYAGEYINKYDNKVLFIAAINVYFDGLGKQDVMDSDMDNYVEINTTAQQVYLKAESVDTTALTLQQIKEYNTDDKVFVMGHATFVDAMEDLDFAIFV